MISKIAARLTPGKSATYRRRPAGLRAVIAAATDDARPVLTGVLFVADPDAGRLTLAASDGFRLSVRECELDAPLDASPDVPDNWVAMSIGTAS